VDVNRKALKAGLAAVGKAVSSRPGIPALTGVLVEAIDAEHVTLTGTDLEVSTRITIDADCDEVDYPAFLVPLKALSTVVRAGTSETVTLEHYDSRAFVDGAAIRLLPADDFPRMTWPANATPERPADYTDVIDAAALVDVIRRVLPFTSDDYARPVLTGVLVRSIDGHADVVATDSYHLVVGSLETVGPDWAAIIPARSLKALAAILGRKASGTVLVTSVPDDSVTFTTDTAELRTRVIIGEYPRYEMLIPPADNAGLGSMSYGRDELAEALKGSAPFTGGTCPLRIDLNGHVILSASAPDLGRFSADLASGAWSGADDFAAAFNPAYLADAVAATDGAPMRFIGDLKPVTLQGAGVTALVMPVRLPA
jgi:DNA polymerase-3 subunit beta